MLFKCKYIIFMRLVILFRTFVEHLCAKTSIEYNIKYNTYYTKLPVIAVLLSQYTAYTGNFPKKFARLLTPGIC